MKSKNIHVYRIKMLTKEYQIIIQTKQFTYFKNKMHKLEL